jgi:hypothetical protein
VAVKVGFELPLVTFTFALLARLGHGYGPRLARLLELPGRLLGGLGCSGGAVMVELFLADGSVRLAALSGREDGQRLAALPCALAARDLCAGHVRKRGAVTAYEFFGARPLVDKLIAAGFELHTDTRKVTSQSRPKHR